MGPSGSDLAPCLGAPHLGGGPRERPRKEVTKLGFLGLRSAGIILGFAKDSHDLYQDLAVIYWDFALILDLDLDLDLELIWIWLDLA